MKNQISITIFKDFFFYLFQCLTLKSNTAWWKWNVFKFLLCLRIERTYVISSLIKRISGILFPWNKTSLNSIRATHNRGNILFEIRSIFYLWWLSKEKTHSPEYWEDFGEGSYPVIFLLSRNFQSSGTQEHSSVYIGLRFNNTDTLHAHH